MSNTTQDATRASFEALRPPRPRWLLLVIAGLVLCILAWAVPGLWQVRLQSDAPSAGTFLVPGTYMSVVQPDIEVRVAGGVAITGVPGVGTAQLAGAWLLDFAQNDEFQNAVTAWVAACETPDFTAVLDTDGCRLSIDDASTLIGYLVARGAPLDDSTALPQRVANGWAGQLVMVWVASQCDDENADSLVVHTKRFGLPIDAKVLIGQMPGCWG